MICLSKLIVLFFEKRRAAARPASHPHILRQPTKMSGKGATNSAVKGTSRVSNNDHKLIRSLWVAKKDNPLEKGRLKRKLTGTEKEARQAMPRECAEAAFKDARKRCKVSVCERPIERDGDNRTMLECFTEQTWPDFCARQSVVLRDAAEMTQFVALLRTGNGGGSRSNRVGKDDANHVAEDDHESHSRASAPQKCAHKIAQTIQKTQKRLSEIFFLGDARHMRFQNYRKRFEKHLWDQQQTLTDIDLQTLPKRISQKTLCADRYKVADGDDRAQAANTVAYAFDSATLDLLPVSENSTMQRLDALDTWKGWRQRNERVLLASQIDRLVSAPSNECSPTATVCEQPTNTDAQAVVDGQRVVEADFVNAQSTVRHANIFIHCDGCNESMSSLDAVTHDNLLFFHKKCIAQTKKVTREFGFDVFN